MARTAKKWHWERNIWTGDAIHRVGEAVRIIRIGNSGPYYCEYWGDYSFDFPVRGTYKPTAVAALKTCSALKRKRKD